MVDARRLLKRQLADPAGAVLPAQHPVVVLSAEPVGELAPFCRGTRTLLLTMLRIGCPLYSIPLIDFLAVCLFVSATGCKPSFSKLGILCISFPQLLV
jgi:hypothetical protein